MAWGYGRLWCLAWAAAFIAWAGTADARCYSGRVVDVYDGDTYTVDITLGFGIVLDNQRLRLLDVDAPEMKGPERAWGEQVTSLLAPMLIGRDVGICTSGRERDNFGRILAHVFLDSERVSNLVNRIIVETKIGKSPVPIPAPRP